jgi:transposase
VLANAAHVKNVPGRKTDVNDAMWLADLLAHGLIRASFVPPVGVQELRSLTRTRKQFVRERSAHVQRIDKLLEDANLKLGVVLSDILGKSGRAVLQAIIDGEDDPQRLATHVSVRVKASRSEVLEALRGRVRAHHRFMLKLHLGHIDALDKAIAEIEREVGRALQPFRQAAKLLSTMPGLSDISANVVVAEIGIDMSRFATPGHLLSWACLCPRNDESAGKRRSTKLRRGGKWLKTTLVQAAWAAIKVKGSYLQAQFHRLRARRGAKKAIIGVAASMLTAAWHMLRNGTEWHDLGAAHFDRADAAKTAARLIRRLQQIGYAVQVTPS